MINVDVLRTPLFVAVTEVRISWLVGACPRPQYSQQLSRPIVKVDALRAPLFVVVCDMRIWTHHADHAPPPQDTRRAVPLKHMISALQPKAS